MTSESSPSHPATAAALYRGGTLADMVLGAIARHPDRRAFANDETVVTYRQLGALISRIAQLFDRLGLQPGDTVAQLGVNRHEVFAVIVAVYMRGLRSVTLHAMASDADHADVLQDSGARVVIVDAYHGARVPVLQAQCPDVRHWLAMGEVAGCQPLEAAIAEFTPGTLVATGDAETVVRLACTGGTTGRSKGVMLSNRALMSNALLDLAAKDWPPDVRYLCVAPISHGAGSMVVPTLVQGGCVTLLRSFSVDGVIADIQRHDCNVTWMVRTMLYALLDSGRTGEVDWSRFHTLVYSGAPTSPSRIRQALDLLGPVLLQSCGQTEAPNDILMLSRDDHARLDDAALASAGRPYPLIRVALHDDQGREVADVQLRPGQQLDAEAVVQAVRQAKGAVATPKRVEFIAALPQTALGKIDKKALRARHWAPDARVVN